MKGIVEETTYHEILRRLQLEKAEIEEQIDYTIEDSWGEILTEVLINVDFDGCRRNIMRKMMSSYFYKLELSSLNTSSVLDALEKSQYVSVSKEEVAWGEKDYFISLTEKGRQVRDE